MGTAKRADKEKEEMRCLISNYCKFKNLCCAKCKRKACEDRCLDNPDTCKYHEKVKIDLKIYDDKKDGDKEKS